MNNFEGIKYRIADEWADIIPVSEYNSRPINYLEIGTFYGANLLSVARTYGAHKDSKLYCIDPWEDYDEYLDINRLEYKYEQNIIYNTFLKNVKNSGFEEKIVINRGYSHKIVSTFDDNFFDMIYIDGNHEPEYVLEDAVLSFRKLKEGGIIVFDDYGWGGPELTQAGINAFIKGYDKRIKPLAFNYNKTQLFCIKIK
jgi:predicted O-methyltransferase YrrM